MYEKTVFVEYIPEKRFNSFVQSAVDAKRRSDENPNSGVVSETMKFPANSSYGYEIIDWTRLSVTRYLSDKETHAAINSKLFKKLDRVNNSMYEDILPKTQTEHKEEIIVGFLILQYAKLRTLELYYNSFTKFCDVNSFEELENDTDSRYLAHAQKEREDCVRSERKQNGSNCGQKMAPLVSLLMQAEISSRNVLCQAQKNT